MTVEASAAAAKSSPDPSCEFENQMRAFKARDAGKAQPYEYVGNSGTALVAGSYTPTIVTTGGTTLNFSAASLTSSR